jgi:CheY-like chemotaxis protein
VATDPGDGSSALHGLARAGAAAAVLVVEDEPAVRDLVVRILREDGYEVLAAEDGQHALGLLDGREGPPDLVVTDVLMPRMNGRQLGDALRQMHPGLPVLYMSGDIGENIVLRQLVPDDAPFLRKPFTPAQLLASVSAVLK